MPRKKKSKALESKKVPLVASNGSLGAGNTADEPDEDTLKKIKEDILNENPESIQMFQYWEKAVQDRTEQAQDSNAVLANKRGKTDTNLILFLISVYLI